MFKVRLYSIILEVGLIHLFWHNQNVWFLIKILRFSSLPIVKALSKNPTIFFFIETFGSSLTYSKVCTFPKVTCFTFAGDEKVDLLIFSWINPILCSAMFHNQSTIFLFSILYTKCRFFLLSCLQEAISNWQMLAAPPSLKLSTWSHSFISRVAKCRYVSFSYVTPCAHQLLRRHKKPIENILVRGCRSIILQNRPLLGQGWEKFPPQRLEINWKLRDEDSTFYNGQDWDTGHWWWPTPGWLWHRPHPLATYWLGPLLCLVFDFEYKTSTDMFLNMQDLSGKNVSFFSFNGCVVVKEGVILRLPHPSLEKSTYTCFLSDESKYVVTNIMKLDIFSYLNNLNTRFQSTKRYRVKKYT